jgi:hypothetical protein
MLKLKQEFIGKRVSMQVSKLGLVEVDTDEISEDKYKAYQDMGFSIFDEVCNKCGDVDCSCKKKPAKKRKAKETDLEKAEKQVKKYTGVEQSDENKEDKE